jgi:5-methyltetrahydrofolate--homocysteine methyltransferase
VVNKEENSLNSNVLDLLKQKILVIDGAMGTMLQANGMKSGECPELWNINHPEIVKQIHTSYLEAGADIILTNTFGANGVKLLKLKQQDRLKEINKQAVKIAREAAEEYMEKYSNQVFIAGSVGPTGEILQPIGPLKTEEAYQGYEDQIKEMASTGVDMILLETFYDLSEIKLALKAVKENTDLPVFASMSFDDSKKTIYGITPERAVEELFKEEADGVGANCGSGPKLLYEIMTRMRTITDSLLLVEPNAGMPYLKDNRVVYPATPEEMAEYAEKFVKLKVNIIGGCCGTTPEHIKAIAKIVKENK